MTDTTQSGLLPDAPAVGIPQAAEMLGCSPQMVRNWINDGVLIAHATQLAQRKRWRVDLASVLALRAQRSPAGPPPVAFPDPSAAAERLAQADV